MPAPLPTTPLFALDAVVLDTETTGLDPRIARVIEIGAVTLAGGRVNEERAWRSLVAAPGPIPAGASAVHGIVAADLVGAPAFPDAYGALATFIGPRVVIGHTIGFDLAVLGRECGLAGLDPPAWPTLDTRLLAQVVDPQLAGFSLEALAAWLDIPVADRHRALGDARLTARIFLGLVPRLRAVGVRTLAEAGEACRRQAQALEGYHRAGWVEPDANPARLLREAAGRRLDAYPYRHRVREAMTSPPVFSEPDASLREGIARMAEGRISSLLVGAPDDPADRLGIVTERDALRALARSGPAALDQPLADLATRPLVAVPSEAYVYRAIGRMRRFNLRHLAVASEEGRVVGMLSARDLLRLRSDAAIALGDDIDDAADVPALAQAWAKVPAMAATLLDEGVGARDVAGIIARELGAATRKAALLAEASLVAEGRGAAPCAFALLVLGSAGRGESGLALDQDHALVFAEGEPDGDADRWFAELGERLAAILHEIGVPLCPGGVMAGNPAFRGSLATWRRRIALWLSRATPEDLLNVDIVFDFRPVHGDGALAAGLWDEAWAAARGAPSFLRLLAEAGAAHESAFGFLGRLKGEEGRIDLKRHGLKPLVTAARLLALRHGVARRSTAERLQGVRALDLGGAADLDGALAIHERLLGLVLRAQIADIAAGRPATNRVPLALVQGLGALDALKGDLRRLESLDELAREAV